jgi:hypothetical protein
MKTAMQRTLVIGLMLVSTTLLNCSKKAADLDSISADESSTGVVASSLGGALSDSSASGTQALYKFSLPNSNIAALENLLSPMPKAHAKSLCPTFRSAAGSGCSVSGGNMWLSYSDCTFTGNADWNGIQQISMSTGSATCGTFPNPGANGTLYRQFVQAAGASAAGSMVLTTNRLAATIDDSVANLGNFDGQTIAAINTNGGYGTKTTFNSSGLRSNVEFGHRLTLNSMLDHSVSGSVAISESAGATSRTLNGTVTVYHNLLHVIGTSTLTNVVHDDVCCLPVGGTISTTFTDGQNVHAGRAGQRLIGKTESMTFTGCGTAEWTTTDGTTASVTLNRCF